MILAPVIDLAEPPAFDHAAIIAAVHEAILGKSLNKPAFRRRMIDTCWIKATGAREAVSNFRPAELYRRKP